MIAVSIVIVHFNTPALTAACIASVIHHTRHLNYEIIVVDNASTVHDAQELKDQFPTIHLFKSTWNRGFAGGNNLGIAYAQGNYILLLNSDTELRENAIKVAWEFIEKTPDAGAVSVRLVYPDGRPQSAAQYFPSALRNLAELLRLQKLLPPKQAGRLLLGPFFSQQETRKVNWIWGTFFFLRKSAVQKMPNQKLDDKFFMYGEDVQWCWDLRKLGYAVYFCADAEVVHHLGASKGDKAKLIAANKEAFLKKNYRSLHRRLIRFTEILLQHSQRR